ncbi:TPA: hypothetical protein ACH3X2_006365 [Trebouxia sp. C0005]
MRSSATPLKLSGQSVTAPDLIHIVVPTECNEYQSWQVLGLYWSWRQVGSPGMFTRIACCNIETLEGQHTVNPFQVYYTKTNVDPEGIGDDYSPYNKPCGVMSWLQDKPPVGDYFLILDADMTFHRSITAQELLVEQGLGAAQAMHYMGQLNQFIAKALLPGPSPTQRHLQVLKATAAPDASAHPSKHTHALTHASASADTKLLATMEEAGQSGQGPLAVRTLLQDNIATESHTTEGQQPSKQQPGDQQPDLPPLDSSEVLADEIGELYMYTASDLRAIAPLWWDYSKQVRSFQDMHAEAESEYNSICFFSTNRRMEILAELPEGTQLEQPWIAEMYGIALAAAHLGIRHSSHPAIVAPSDQQRNWLNKEGPDMIVSHYAWNVEVPSLHWKWNKHAFHEWSALTCPPWSLGQQAEREAWETEYNGSSSGLFPHPPMPSELIHQEPADLFQDLASIEIVAMLNEAFCELHHKPYCPASEELSRECGKVSPNTLAENSFCL